MTSQDSVATAMRTVIDADASSIVVPPVAVLQRRARRRRTISLLASSLAVLAAVGTAGAVVNGLHSSAVPNTPAAGGGPTAASIEVREVLEARAPVSGGTPLRTAAAYSDAAFATSSCDMPTPLPQDRVAGPPGEVMVCSAEGTELLHLAGAAVADGDVARATADQRMVALRTSADGAAAARSLIESTEGKRIALLVNGVAVSAPAVGPPSVTAPTDQLAFELPTADEASQIAAAINGSR